MNRPSRKSILCPNCRRIISVDESRCPHCNMAAPGSRWKNNPLVRGWASGDQLIRIIIYSNVFLFVLSLVLSSNMFASGFNPLNFLAPSSNTLLSLGATGTVPINRIGWWTLVSANYLHGSLMHLLFNMVVLNQIGSLTARIYGSNRFFAIYTISGIGGFLISYMANISITVGASSALFGLIGAALYYGKSRGGTYGQAIYKQIGTWAIFIILLGFIVPQVNNWAHIGGMASGALIAMLLGYEEKSREGIKHRVLAGACMGITLLILLYAILRGVIILLF